ncbi:MAG: PaaI family thioesterase [Sneathiellales bacterium]|nr:PaaI family thioesterase [Sneathiellales bacterium]
MNDAIPEGFTPIELKNGYIGHTGPFYFKAQEDGHYRYGFQTDERHANPNNVVHGAALTGFVDTIFGRTIVMETGRMCATISLTTNFASGAPVGSWVEATSRITSTTKSMAFVTAEVFQGEQLVMNSTSVFKLFGKL